MSDLTALLLAVWHGDAGALGPLADWLEERTDSRAWLVRVMWHEAVRCGFPVGLHYIIEMFPDVVLPVGLLGWSGRPPRMSAWFDVVPRIAQVFVVNGPSPQAAFNAVNSEPVPEYPPGVLEYQATQITGTNDGRWEVRREFIVRNPPND